MYLSNIDSMDYFQSEQTDIWNGRIDFPERCRRCGGNWKPNEEAAANCLNLILSIIKLDWAYSRPSNRLRMGQFLSLSSKFTNCNLTSIQVYRVHQDTNAQQPALSALTTAKRESSSLAVNQPTLGSVQSVCTLSAHEVVTPNSVLSVSTLATLHGDLSTLRRRRGLSASCVLDDLFWKIYWLLSKVYNASNNELVRTNTLVKSAIILVDATPFRQWYESHVCAWLFYFQHVADQIL